MTMVVSSANFVDKNYQNLRTHFLNLVRVPEKYSLRYLYIYINMPISIRYAILNKEKAEYAEVFEVGK